MTAATEIAVVPKENALQVYSADQGLDPYLAKIRAEIDSFVPDVTTTRGRKDIASIAYKVRQSKTALDNVGKELVADLKELPKKIDAERKRMRDLLDSWTDEVRKPLSEWEQREEDRVTRIKAQVGRLSDTDVTGMPASEIKQSIENLEAHVVDALYEEFEPEAHRVKAASLTTLREALAKREQYEAEQVELARLRQEAAEREQKEREERIAREAAEQAKREAEQRAQAERDAAAKREAELVEKAAQAQRQADQDKRDAAAAAEQARLNAELAEQRRIAAEKQAELDRVAAEQRQAEAVERAAQAERQRQADEQARVEAESKAREADRAHKGATLKAAKEAVMKAGITEEQAVAVVKLIAAGKVPAVSIQY